MESANEVSDRRWRDSIITQILVDTEGRNKSFGTIQSAIMCDTNGKGKSNLLGVIHTVSNWLWVWIVIAVMAPLDKMMRLWGLQSGRSPNQQLPGGSNGALRGRAFSHPYLSSWTLVLTKAGQGKSGQEWQSPHSGYPNSNHCVYDGAEESNKSSPRIHGLL